MIILEINTRSRHDDANTGVDTYGVFTKQANGLEVVIGKGAIKYLHPAAAE